MTEKMLPIEAAMSERMLVSEHVAVPPGWIVLKRHGVIVWACRLTEPWEDVECDEVVVCPQDYEALFKAARGVS